MRTAPIGLAHRQWPDRLRHDAALSAVVTHASPMAVASAVLMAWSAAVLACTAPGTLVPGDFINQALGGNGDLADPGSVERKPGAKRRIRLTERLAEVPEWLRATPDDAFDYFHNGAFVLEALPAAFWCFLRTPNLSRMQS